MFKLNLFAFLVLVSLGGCKTHYALFQEGSNTSIPKISDKKFQYPLRKLKAKQAELINGQKKLPKTISFLPVFFSEPKVENLKVEIPDFLDVKESQIMKVRQDPKEKEKRKKKQKRQKFWRQMGSNLLIGVVFLGLAIVLSIVHMQTLALLFGFASILFLIFGLKKVFKKKNRRIRNPFK
jgi:hypothetical protein